MLYENEKGSGGDKVAQLLSQDFSLDKNKKTALKNATKLLTLKRFEFAAAFFLLGENLKTCLQIIVKNLNDPILAVLVCRMMMLQWDKTPEKAKMARAELDTIYEQHFLNRGKLEGDVYLTAIGLWGTQKYIQAVNSLKVN